MPPGLRRPVFHFFQGENEDDANLCHPHPPRCPYGDAGDGAGIRSAGAENVHNAEGKRVDEAGCGPQAGTFDARGDEYDRLCAKYGVERMEQVFGKKGSAAFDKAISGASAKTAKSRQAAG